jgi:ferredoxin-NADP reductase
VLREVLRNPSDPTRCALLYANKAEADIWMRKELDDMAARFPDRRGAAPPRGRAGRAPPA